MLLLDEPLAGLDLHHQMALLRLLKQLAAQGLLVVVAIHDINLAIDGRIACSACNRAAWWGGDVGIIDEALLERVFQIRTAYRGGRPHLVYAESLRRSSLIPSPSPILFKNKGERAVPRRLRIQH